MNNQEALDHINNKIDDNYKVISFVKEYKNQRTTKCIVECKIHGLGKDWGTPWLPKYSDLNAGAGCPKCSKVYKIKEPEALSNINKSLKNSPLKVVKFRKYTGKNSKCIVECKIHGKASEWSNPWFPNLSLLKKTGKCLKCEGKYKRTESEFLEELNRKTYPKSFKIKNIIGKLTNIHTRCNLVCSIHGEGEKWENPWTPTLNALKHIKGEIKCLKCSGTYREGEKELFNIVSKKIDNKNLKLFEFYDKFANRDTKCILKCKIHGRSDLWNNPWIPTITQLLRYNHEKCPKCAKKYSYSSKDLIEKIYKITKKKKIKFDGFIGKFKGLETKCDMTCDIHGKGSEFRTPWIPTAASLLKGNGCLICGIQQKELSICLKHPEQFDQERTLYYITFKNKTDNSIFYKIGLANPSKGVKGRFPNTLLKKDNVEIINKVEIILPNIIALITEYYALQYFDSERKYMLHVLKNCDGGTECFRNNILDLISIEYLIEMSSDSFEDIISNFELENKKEIINQFKKIESYELSI